MATSRRTDIIDLLVSQLKEIDGAESSFDSDYTYNVNLYNNVERKIKFLDEVNDFPDFGNYANEAWIEEGCR